MLLLYHAQEQLMRSQIVEKQVKFSPNSVHEHG